MEQTESCNKDTGQCNCKDGFSGNQCEKCSNTLAYDWPECTRK